MKDQNKEKTSLFLNLAIFNQDPTIAAEYD